MLGAGPKLHNSLLSLLSSARRKKQRSIHPLQGLPLYGEVQLTTRENPLRQSFGMPRKACAPSGRGMIIISKMTFDGHFYLNVLCEGGSSHLSS